MSFSSGVFSINSAGQPVVADTVISPTVFNAFTADIATGLSTCILKDGTQTATAAIPFFAGTVSLPGIYLSTDTTTGFYRPSANNLSVTVSGTKLLQFATTVLSMTGQLSLAAGTVSAPSAYFSTNTGTGLYQIGANDIGFTVSGTKLLEMSGTTFAVTGTQTIVGPAMQITDTANASQQLILVGSQAYNASPTSGVLFNGKYTSGGAIASFSSIHGFKVNATDGNQVGGIYFNCNSGAGEATCATLLNGSFLVASATAIPAGGTAATGYMFSSTANFGIFFGSGVPSLSAAQGSLYLCSNGSSTSTRAYINTNGSTGWTAITTAA